MKTIKGNYYAENLKVGIVVGRFNSFITHSLLEGCLDALERGNVKSEDITQVFVPGAYEIPGVAAKMAASEEYDVIIALGAVIRGATTHYDLVSGEVASGISAVERDYHMPVIFGVITTENIEQAIERSGTTAGNHGFGYGQTAIEMVNVYRQLP